MTIRIDVVLVTDKLRSYCAAKSEMRLSARHERTPITTIDNN
jgi:hypothetical protein